MKSTEQLIHQIKNAPEEDLSFLRGPDYSCPSITIYLCSLLAERGMEVREVIARLGLDRSYGYQLFNGIRKPTRVVLLRLAVLLGLGLEETDRLLKIGRKEVLYPRRREDALAIYVIEKRLPLERLDSLLEEAYE